MYRANNLNATTNAEVQTNLPDYPSEERQVLLRKRLLNLHGIIVKRSDVPIYSLFESVARLDLNTTTVFQEKVWVANEVQRELNQIRTNREAYARYATEEDMLLLDRLTAYLEKLLDPPVYSRSRHDFWEYDYWHDDDVDDDEENWRDAL